MILGLEAHMDRINTFKSLVARALESNKWIARGTSDGISTIVDNNGTIVNILNKGKRGSLNGNIYHTLKSSFFLYIWLSYFSHFLLNYDLCLSCIKI